MARLLELYRQIAIPAGGSDLIAVRRLHDGSSVWAGRDAFSRPVVIIETSPGTDAAYGVVLRHFVFEPWTTCRITDSGNVLREVTASVIRCTDADEELQQHFLRALSPACEEMRLNPRVADIALLVEKLIEVFQALSQPSSNTVQGLWAELFLISRARDIRLATLAWQPRQRSLIDFEHGRVGLEIKSSTGPLRQHRFKLAQLRPQSGSIRYVASFMLNEVEHGESLSDLWDRIEMRLDSECELKERVAVRIAQSLGKDWRLATFQRFDANSASATICVFDSLVVPRVGEDAAASITDIEFSVDLSGLRPTSFAQLISEGELLESLFSEMTDQ